VRQLRKSKITDEIITEILAMRRKGGKMVCIAYDLNISVGTVHKYLKKYGNEQEKI
jgi:DNA-binding NarL/FixJ family response regulator